MAVFQVATNTPSKAEIMAEWIVEQPWGPESSESLAVVGSYHLEDPKGQVGMQGHILHVNGRFFHVPLTYRSERNPDLESAYVSTMEHSVLGTRYLYDGFGDDLYISVLAGVAASGYGQSLGFAEVDGRLQAWPESARLHGYGRTDGRLLVDGFDRVDENEGDITFRNESIKLDVYRRLVDRSMPEIGVAATWTGRPNPDVIATVEVNSQ